MRGFGAFGAEIAGFIVRSMDAAIVARVYCSHKTGFYLRAYGKSVHRIKSAASTRLSRIVIHRSVPVFCAFPIARVDALKSLNLIQRAGAIA